MHCICNAYLVCYDKGGGLMELYQEILLNALCAMAPEAIISALEAIGSGSSRHDFG